MSKQEQEWQVFGVYVHGVLTAMHALGVFYNVRRRNWIDAIAHGSWLVYDADATRRHWRDR